MKKIFSHRFFVFAVLLILLAIPAPALACGGGGGGGGEGGGFGFGSMDPGLGDVAGGSLDLSNLPDFSQLTPQQIMEMQARAAHQDAAMWDSATNIAERAAQAGKLAQWGMAIMANPAYVTTQIALAAGRGGADGYARSAGHGALGAILGGLIEGGTANLNPAIGIGAGELAGRGVTHAGTGPDVGKPTIGDAAMEQSRVTQTSFGAPMPGPPVYQ